MTNLFLAFLAVAGLCVAAFVTLQVVSAWRRWRGTRIIICPETERPAAVDLDLRYALAGSILGRPELRLRDCSRWPERSQCGQVCLSQVEETTDACLVRVMLDRWYEGKTCAYCRRAFVTIHGHDHERGLRSPEGRLREWSEVPPETLPEVLFTHQAVCRNCLAAESFRLEFPDVVVDRPPRPDYRAAPPPG